jgi:hypothetical protein
MDEKSLKKITDDGVQVDWYGGDDTLVINGDQAYTVAGGIDNEGVPYLICQRAASDEEIRKALEYSVCHRGIIGKETHEPTIPKSIQSWLIANQADEQCMFEQDTL